MPTPPPTKNSEKPMRLSLEDLKTPFRNHTLNLLWVCPTTPTQRAGPGRVEKNPVQKISSPVFETSSASTLAGIYDRKLLSRKISLALMLVQSSKTKSRITPPEQPRLCSQMEYRRPFEDWTLDISFRPVTYIPIL